MPALTIPVPSPPPDHPSNLPSSRDLPNPYPRPSSTRPHRHPDAVYTHAHFDSSYHERLYSPSLPPHPSSAVFSHFALPQAPANWHIPLLQHNPYPPPQPPQLVHKVWILDCRSCGTFLTNRGMKASLSPFRASSPETNLIFQAVLLLRPNVSLFSTDALPVNCSAYSTNPDALHPPPCRPATLPSAPRTCECLTQTLCCHTCGTAVGYMIVIPCSRCTSSISATNRATNGHRFVFHSSEIIPSERHHIPDEPGVLPVEYPTPPPPPSSPPPLAPAYPYPPVFHSADVVAHRRPDSSMPSQAFPPLQTSFLSPGPDHPPSPQMESPDSAFSSAPSSPELLASVPPASPRRSPRTLSQTQFPHNLATQTLSEPRGTTPEPSPRKLKAGDVLYWHHLAKHGEIPGVEEDPRARIPNWGDALKFLER
ncbi:hypothetical protein J3R82DRAFT_10773 [Butyriboletus roseoflavus]|nr:hypothetical protein J3R82DRAFT_10773 [Butyriboletus roseoflavus]